MSLFLQLKLQLYKLCYAIDCYFNFEETITKIFGTLDTVLILMYLYFIEQIGY